jgi:anti-anti-sigma factor
VRSRNGNRPSAGPHASRAAVERLAGDIAVVVVEGEMDLATAPVLIRALGEAVDSASQVIVDLTGARFIDSTAIAAIVDSARRLDDSFRSLSVVLDPASQPGRVWHVVGVSPPIPRHDSRGDAELDAAGAQAGGARRPLERHQ